MIDGENNIVSTLLYDDSYPYNGHRFYAKITLEGELLRLVEDSASQTATIWSNAMFLFPDDGRVGIFRRNAVTVHPPVNQVLCKLNDELEADSIHGFGNFAHDTLDMIHVKILSMTETALGTVLPMNDTTLLFSFVADQWLTNTNNHDVSALLFKTDLEGNIQQHCVIGNWNDTLETTNLVLQSADFARYSSMEKRFLYQTCLSRDQQPYLERPNTFFVTKLTDDFEILWKKSYTKDDTFFRPRYLTNTSDGGCLVVGYVRKGETYYDNPHYNMFALKLNANGTTGTNEIIVKDEMFFYPNPVKDQLLMQFSPDVQPKQIELYDLQGRLVSTQSKAFESIDMSQLPAGTYTMRVTMQDGNTFSDKVVKN